MKQFLSTFYYLFLIIVCIHIPILNLVCLKQVKLLGKKQTNCRPASQWKFDSDSLILQLWKHFLALDMWKNKYTHTHTHYLQIQEVGTHFLKWKISVIATRCSHWKCKSSQWTIQTQRVPGSKVLFYSKVCSPDLVSEQFAYLWLKNIIKSN